MDVMGITKEELIDGVELAGVASYLGDAEVSNVNPLCIKLRETANFPGEYKTRTVR